MTDDATFDELVQRIKALRKAKGWSAEKLAQEMAAVGVPWERQVVTKLENGRRRILSLVELYALTYVLEEPGILLLFPVGSAETVEVLPGRRVEAWAAAKWFMGEGHIDGPATERVEAAAAPVTLWRNHEQLVDAYHGLLDEQLLDQSTEQDRAFTFRRDLMLRDLRHTRAEMRRHGLTPPDLPDRMAHVDDRRHAYLTQEDAEALRSQGVEVRAVDFSDRKGRDDDAS